MCYLDTITYNESRTNNDGIHQVFRASYHVILIPYG